VRIVAPTAPGGAPDILARLIGPWLSGRLGQQFVVENRPGGGSNIGTEAVVRAPPDGYTLLMVSTIQAINATLYSKLNFNFIRDIAPVAAIIRQPLVMVVNPSVPDMSFRYATVAQLAGTAFPRRLFSSDAGAAYKGDS